MMAQSMELGDWKYISELGSGAFGTVMLWKNDKNSEFVAIKKCKFQKANVLSLRQKERWANEVNIMKEVDHVNVIKFKPLAPELEKMVNNPSKLPLLSMEYCKKGNLRRYLLSEPVKLCGLNEQDVRFILQDISSGLNYLHSKKITHRDVKPDNIVLQHCDIRKGQTVYKIIDLGYAKELVDSTLSLVGTLHYLAPEIFYNQRYTRSVDYWSMGMMVFEVICGTLPFLPETFTPFERYEHIKAKDPEDICIYMSYSGSISTSKELKRENFITSCLKLEIENWLKKVLQFNPASRCFQNEISAFDHLQYILDKTIIQVFSVYKLEFYSYEITDGTLLGTLKDWISRDIKVDKNELLLLFSNDSSKPASNCNNDDALVESLVRTEDCIIFVFKKGAILSDVINYAYPNLIKELFNGKSSFQLKFARQLYRQAIFYVYTENQTVLTFKKAFFLFINYIHQLSHEAKDNYLTASKDLYSLLLKIKAFIDEKKQNQCDINLSENKELIDCLKYFERLFCNVERREQNLKDFYKEVRVLEKLLLEIANVKVGIEDMFNACDINREFNKINSKIFLEKENGVTNEVILRRIIDVISDTVKCKYKLFSKNEELKSYSKDFVNLLNSSEELVKWIKELVLRVNNLSDDFILMEENYQKILLKAVENNKKEQTLCSNLADSVNLMKENTLLRCQFENALSQSLLAHTNFVQDSSTL